MRKILTLVLAVLMVMSVVSVSSSAAFTDVPASDAALSDAVSLLTTLGVAKGTSETTFGTENLVTREQFALFTYRLMKAGKDAPASENTSKFVDLADPTYNYAIAWATQSDIIKGTSATTFNPKGNIKLQDAYTMIVRALGYEKDQTLPYPFGYIAVAEDIGLDEDLPSTLNYTDSLTRGNMAIILANAFYADMNEKTSEYVERKLSDGTYTLVLQETNETIAHKVFGVEKETWKVLATPHYGYTTANAATAADKNDVDLVKVARFDSNDKAIATSVVEFKDLKLAGKADDYFLADLTAFVKKDGNDVAKDKVLASQSNLVKTTVKASDITIGRETGTDAKYYVDKDKDNDKLMTGYVTFGNTKAYFTNAPYSYTDVEKGAYVSFIDLVGGDASKNTYAFADNGGFDSYDFTSAGKTQNDFSKAFAAAYSNIYNAEGLFEIDVYDVDGNGYAEYLFYKPYTYGKIYNKKGDSYKTTVMTGNVGVKNSTVSSTMPVIYTYEGVIEGVEYNNNDIVLAYVNGPANYVKVAEVLKEQTAKVTKKTTSSTNPKNNSITLSTGEVVKFNNIDKKILVASEFAAPAISAFAVGKTATFCIAGDMIIYSTAVSTTGFDANAKYAMVQLYDPYAESGDENYGKVVYTASGVSNGEFVSYYYVNALIDGTVKAVKLADTVYTTYPNTIADGVEIAEYKIDTKARAEQVMAGRFLGKFATYTVDGEGTYTFTEIITADGVNDNKKENLTGSDDGSYALSASTNTIKRYTSSIYEFGTSIDTVKRFSFKPYSKFILRSYDNDEKKYVYTTYTSENLPDLDTTDIKNIEGIFVNNTAGNTMEYLGIMYAELVGDDVNIKAGETKQYRYIYAISEEEIDGSTKKTATVYNFLTGAIENNVEIKSGLSIAEGNIGEVVDNKITTKTTVGSTYSTKKIFAAEVEEYDFDNKMLKLAGDSTIYMLNDSTVISYLNGSEFSKKDVDIFENEDYQNASGNYNVYIVARNVTNEDYKLVDFVVVKK